MSPTQHLVEVYLKPGEYVVGDANYRIRTLLGSCVSVTIWHPLSRIGAMCHFLLPSRGHTWPTQPDSRYGDEAIWLMLRDLSLRHVPHEQCQAKIFGGGDMFPNHGRATQMKVGDKNGLTARALLSARGIPIVSESLFGVGHRNIVFDVASGHVWSRQSAPESAPPSAKKISA